MAKEEVNGDRVAGLMVHQEQGVQFLLHKSSGLLAFEQGLGKTRVALESFRRLRTDGTVQRLIVICPNSLKRNWVEEVAKFTPELKVCIVQGPARERRRTLSQTHEPIIVINYEAARSEMMSIRALMGRTSSVLVLDESHFVKNLRSLNNIAVRQLAPLTRFRWLLSGTPVTNAPADIYAQVSLVAGDRLLGSFAAFIAEYGDADSLVARREALWERISPYVFRRTKEQCLDLPEKIFVDLYVPLPDWQRRLYDTTRHGIIESVRKMSRQEFIAFAPTALTTLLRLAQLASNPSLILPNELRLPGKVAEIDRLLNDLVERNLRKVVVWSHYVGNIEMLVERYAKFGSVALYGGVPAEERQVIVKKFQEDPNVHVLIGNPAAGGTGFTLTAANYCIYETLNWRYDLYAQSQDRLHRIGQTLPVTYIRLLAEDTIDEAIAKALVRKAEMAQTIVGDEVVPLSVAAMTPDEFCTLLATNTLPPAGLTGPIGTETLLVSEQ